MKASQCLGFALPLLISGCLNIPTQQEIATADYGLRPTKEEAEAAAHAVMQSVLKDPTSAIWSCSEPSQGYIGSSAMGGRTAYGWVIACDINGKNSFGAYAGAQRYGFVIYNGSVTRAAMFSGMAQQVVYQAFM